MPALQSKFDEILAPHRTQGTLSNHLTEARKKLIIIQLTEALFTYFQSLCEEDLKQLYRKALLISHPDRGDVKEDLILNDKIILRLSLIHEINRLAQATSQISPTISTNTGEFFRLIQHAHESYLHSQNELPDEVTDEISFTNWLKKFINNLDFYTVANQKMVLRSWFTLIYAEVSPSQYYVGLLGDWIKYQIQKNLYQALYHANNKSNSLKSLRELLRASEYDLLFDSFRDPQHIALPFLDDVFSSVYPAEYEAQADLLLPPSPPTFYSPNEAIIHYHLEVAKSELKKNTKICEFGLVEIAIRGWVTSEGQPLTAKLNKTDYYQTQLYLSIWHILYASPTALSNFNFSGGRSTITKFASIEHTEKQYKTLRTLFSDLKNPTVAFLNQQVTEENRNWLIEAVDWVYAHGFDTPIARPWVMRKGIINHVRAEDSFDAASDIRESRVLETVLQYIENFALSQRLKSYPLSFMVIPFLFTGALFPLLLQGTLLNNFILGLLAPLFCMMMIKSISWIHCILENSLNALAQFNTPFSLAVPTSVPRIFQQYYGQAIAPLWRILSQPLKDSLAQKQKEWLRVSFMGRALLATMLSLFTSFSFALDRGSLLLTEIIGITLFSLINIPFSLYDFAKQMAWPEKLQPDNVALPSISPQDFLAPRSPMLLIKGPKENEKQDKPLDANVEKAYFPDLKP